MNRKRHNCIAYAREHRMTWEWVHGRDRHCVWCSMVYREYMVDNQDCVWCLIRWARLNGTTSNGVARFIEMEKGKYLSGINKLG